ncbi:MAG: hydantoinase/oxoprolinase family protein [Candidatus Abyssubacteria bacterium]
MSRNSNSRRKGGPGWPPGRPREISNLGVDTGGTFTDFVLAEHGTLIIHKIASTPFDPAEAFLEGVEKVCSLRLPASITHGSTVATNALLERKGARIALVTTAGFEDILQIGRQNRPSLYDLGVEKPPPLVRRDDIFGVDERTLYDGTVEREPERGLLERLVSKIAMGGYDAVAVCFLHSYANAMNERLVGEALRETGLPISLSHLVLPEYREYERFSTTSVNAFVSPVMSEYLGSIEDGLQDSTRLRVMQSNGGSISASRARVEAVQTILSGPAAGVVGAVEAARHAGFERIITFDMGGTSTDVSLCDGAISMRTRSSIGGVPIGIPVVDIHTVGAGGGSIAWLDSAGSLHVGPQSAGAQPGPVCYGAGAELTVTDANLCLGRMFADRFLGGAMRLDFDRARVHMLEFANKLGKSPDEAAEGILKVANTTMERAVRVISVERGHDPRGFSLVAFGGAGPMHACDLARALAIPRVVVPLNPGVLSALGLLMADVTKDFSQTVLVRTDTVTRERLESFFRPLEEQARSVLSEEGFSRELMNLSRFLDLRYVGQSYEVTIPDTAEFLPTFHSEHHRLYGHSNSARPVELVNIRLVARGMVERPEFPTIEGGRAELEHAIVAFSETVFSGTRRRTPVYERERLGAGSCFAGPAVIVELSATTVVTPDFEAEVDRFGNILMKAL